MTNKRLKLKKGREKPALFSHPWIFSGAVESVDEDLKKGDFADVYSFDENYLGSGFFNPESDIAVRLFEFKEKGKSEQEIIATLIENAVFLRKNMYDKERTTTLRLIHGEADLLPGLICDLYDNVVALQFNLAGLYFIKDFIVKKIATALKKHLNIDLVCAVDKTSDKTLKLEGIEKECTFLLGKAEEKVLVKESGFTFAVDISGGQKTGFYSDQRENRKIISSYVKGLKGYDLFCYTGGFSVYLAGSNDLTCVDSSQGALDLLKENLSLNNLLAEVVCTDVYKYLNEINETDFINADPPKYIFRDRDIKNGIKKYELLYSFCLSKIRSGGYLGASSCSGLLGFDDFISVISKSAHKAGKKLQMLHSYRGGHDYPLYLSCPESSYLKFALFKVL